MRISHARILMQSIPRIPPPLLHLQITALSLISLIAGTWHWAALSSQATCICIRGEVTQITSNLKSTADRKRRKKERRDIALGFAWWIEGASPACHFLPPPHATPHRELSSPLVFVLVSTVVDSVPLHLTSSSTPSPSSTLPSWDRSTALPEPGALENWTGERSGTCGLVSKHQTKVLQFLPRATATPKTPQPFLGSGKKDGSQARRTTLSRPDTTHTTHTTHDARLKPQAAQRPPPSTRTRLAGRQWYRSLGLAKPAVPAYPLMPQRPRRQPELVASRCVPQGRSFLR